MGDPNVIQIQQTPKKLISVDFELEPWHGILVLLDSFVEIVLVVVHDDV